MNQYKVGDRVRIISGFSDLEKQLVGRIGTVVKVKTITDAKYYCILIDGFDNPHREDSAIVFYGPQLTEYLGDTRESACRAMARYYEWCGLERYIIKDIESADYISKAFVNENKIGRLMPKIKNVIYNRPATIVFWKDGTKTVVKCENEEFDPEKGLAIAIAKKALGNNYHYYDVFKKWLPND